MICHGGTTLDLWRFEHDRKNVGHRLDRDGSSLALPHRIHCDQGSYAALPGTGGKSFFQVGPVDGRSVSNTSFGLGQVVRGAQLHVLPGGSLHVADLRTHAWIHHPGLTTQLHPTVGPQKQKRLC